MVETKTKGRSLIYYGNPVLRQKALPVDTINAEIRELIDEMFYIMKKEDGVGLAAPQIGELKRVLVIDLSPKDGPVLHIINPVIKMVSDEKFSDVEGCLSIPGVSAEVERYYRILVEGYDRDGKPISVEAEGLLSRALQHEMDHLDGILFIDRVPTYVKKQFQKELKDIKRRFSRR